MIESEEPPLDYDEINDSELVALCGHLGMTNVSRAWPRHLIILALETMDPLTDLPNPLDAEREKVSKFYLRWWDRIQMQVPKKVCPNCHLCRDLQALSCYQLNSQNL